MTGGTCEISLIIDTLKPRRFRSPLFLDVALNFAHDVAPETELVACQVLRVFQVVHETSRAQVVDREGV